MRWREKDGVRWLEAELPGARAVFSTRLGGMSAPPFDTLNLGRLTGDPAVRQNRHRLAAALELDPERVLIGRQVHGTHVIRHRGPTEPRAYAEPAPGLPEADGHVAPRNGLAPLVFVADCLPVALAGDAAVAMIHCGWRGLAGGIVERGVVAAGATAAAIGPGIGPCCYEVGDEVIAAFSKLGPGVASGALLDLREVARRFLEAAGVEEIEISELCTSCNPDLFFSHRRDHGRTGRQAGLVRVSDGVGQASEPAATMALQLVDTGREAKDVAGGVD